MLCNLCMPTRQVKLQHLKNKTLCNFLPTFSFVQATCKNFTFNLGVKALPFFCPLMFLFCAHWAPPCSVTVSQGVVLNVQCEAEKANNSKQSHQEVQQIITFFMNISLSRHHHPLIYSFIHPLSSSSSQKQIYSNNRWSIGMMNFIWSLSGPLLATYS